MGIDITYEHTKVGCANNTTLEIIGKANLTILLGHKYITHDFYVSNEVAHQCIIGTDIIKPYGIVLNAHKDIFFFDDDPIKTYPLLDGCQKLIFMMQPQVSNFDKVPIREIDYKIQELISEFPTVCRTDNTIGQTDMMVHKIELIKDEIYKERPRFYVGAEAAEIERQCQDLLQNGLIRRSKSPYGFNVVLDKKQDGGYRMTVNYKKLNKITKLNATPMHNANNILRLLPVGGIFSKIDLKSGFWQIRMHEDSIPYTAFYGNGVLYEFKVLPFGLVTAPATFVTLMNRVLEGYIIKFCYIYMDDIIVFSKNEELHLQHLRLIFERLRDAKLSINLKKCSFAKKTIEYLGHIVTEKGIKPTQRK